MEAIKRIIKRKNFALYNIPNSFGEKAEIIIIPFSKEETNSESYALLKAQENNGSVDILNQPEEDAWNEL